MKIYFAPLEGITGYTFRNTFNDMFGSNIDKYYTPFIMAHEKRGLNFKEQNDVSPLNNAGLKLVPQVLVNSSYEYLHMEKCFSELGYDEINLNFGCPSQTVVTKKRGSGILLYPDILDKCLYEIFSSASCKVSVKTRIGYDTVDDAYDILSVFNKYPIKELTVHPRLRNEFYNGNVHLDVFDMFLKESVNPLVYNGNIFSLDDYNLLLKRPDFDKVSAVMIGRGLVRNPLLADEICGNVSISREKLLVFLEKLSENYTEVMPGETPVLFKMKEIWSFFVSDNPDYPGFCFDIDMKLFKKMKKTTSLSLFLALQREILS